MYVDEDGEFFFTAIAIGTFIGAAILGQSLGVSGILTGAAYGAATGAVTGSVTGGLNVALYEKNIAEGMKNGAITGGITGGVMGAAYGGYTAYKNGDNMWWGTPADEWGIGQGQWSFTPKRNDKIWEGMPIKQGYKESMCSPVSNESTTEFLNKKN